MLKMLLPVFLVVFSNVIYNLSAKTTPQNVNSFLSLTVSYIIAAAFSFFAFCVSGAPKSLPAEFSKLNFTSVILGISIVGLELGNILIYRAGWKLSVGSLVANSMLACILLVIGISFFKESISLRQIIGIAICLVGLILVTK